MEFINKKPLVAVIFSFILGLAVMGLIVSVSGNSRSLKNVGSQSAIDSQVEQRIATQRAAMEARQNRPQLSGVNMSGTRTTAMQRPMEWKAAASLLERAPIEKIEVNGLELKIYLKGGMVFVTTQDKKDAYVDIIKTNPAKIQIVK